MELEKHNTETEENEAQEVEAQSDNVAVVVTKRSWGSVFTDKYSAILSRFHWLVMLVVFLVVVLFTVISVLVRDLPTFDDPIKGFEPRGTEIKDRTLSYVNLKRDPQIQGSWNRIAEPSCEDNVFISSIDYNVSGLRFKRDALEGCSLEYGGCAGIVFTHVNDKNLLTPSNLKTICSIQITGSNNKLYKPFSIGDYLGQFLNRSCSSLDDDSITAGLNHLDFCAPYYYQTTKDWKGKDISCLEPYNYECEDVPESCRKDHIIFVILHMMVDKGFMPDGRLDQKRLSTSMAFIDLIHYTEEGESELEFIYEDYFKKSSRIFNDVKAVGLNFNIKYDVFSEYLFNDTIYIGMAAIFVMVLICFYTKSPFISFAAFLNMIFSLSLAYFIYTIIFNLNFFPFLNVSTALLLVAIGADDTFIFCDLWEDASKLHVGSPRKVILGETMKHATMTMLVTSLTTASAFYASAFSPIIAVRCFGVYAGTAIMVNFLLTITWLPAAVMLNDTLKCTFCSFSKYCPNLMGNIANSILPNAIIKLRFLWVGLLTCLGIGGLIVIFFVPGLQKPTSSEFQVFKSDDIFEQYDNIYKHMFRFEERTNIISGAVLFGLEAVDNGKKWDPDDTGTVRYQSGLDISAEDSQIWLQEFCQKLKSFNTEGSYIQGCFLDSFITSMQLPCQCNYTQCCNQTGFPFPSNVFKTCLSSILPYPKEHGLYIDVDDGIKTLEISFSTFRTFSMEYSVMDSFWKDMEQWMEDNVVNVPKTLGQPWFIPPFYVSELDYYDYLNFYDLQDSLARSTPISIIISIVVASLVLLITQRNVLISLYSMLSLSGTIFTTIGSLVLLGWELNILESVTFSITVGLSVDFTIHYGVAYLHSSDPDRKSRMRYSVKAMALAIAFAAFSTFSVGAFMMGATVLVYRQLGTFLMIVMVISWLFSTLFFQSLCYLLGPEGSKCKLQCKK